MKSIARAGVGVWATAFLFSGLLLLGVLLLGALRPDHCQAADLGSEAQLADGKLLYDKHCAQCHGVAGDAKAPAAGWFKPAPRDFTSGKYKVRLTGTGELPTDGDIKRSIRQGLAFHLGVGAYTVMPPWPRLSEPQVANLTYYLKSFAADFADPTYNNPKVETIPPAPAYSEESAVRGKDVFDNNDCVKCHGNLGRGDGPSAPTLKDDWGYQIKPADLTKRWTFRGGSAREDIYRTVTTGFNGTPMPAYGEALAVEKRWELVDYLYSLSPRNEPGYSKPDKPIVAVPIVGEISLESEEKLAAAFAEAPESVISIVGQVIEPGRNPYPAVDEIIVQAVYSEKEIALMLRWHDLRADTSTSNAPDLKTELFTPEQPKPAGGATASEDDDPFADEEVAEVDPFAEDEAGDDSQAESGSADASKYSDAIAVQFPQQIIDGFELPYFLFGDGKNTVDLWFRDLGAAKAGTYRGKGSGSVTKQDNTGLDSFASYLDGQWTVVFKRSRLAEGQINFDEKSMIPITFSVWDGFYGEYGNRRGVASWYNLYVEPSEKESPIIPMLTYGVGLFLLELVIIGLVRKKNQKSGS